MKKKYNYLFLIIGLMILVNLTSVYMESKIALDPNAPISEQLDELENTLKWFKQIQNVMFILIGACVVLFFQSWRKNDIR